MKLQELDTLKQQDKAEQVLEDRLGYTVSFDNLSMYESRHMLMRVRGLLNEHRSSTAFHSSERDPAYLKLLMIESGLKGRLKEVAPVVPGQPGAAPVAGTVPPKPGQPAANPANVAMDMAAKKKQAQDAVKQIDAQIKSLTQQKTQMMQQANNPMAENRKGHTIRRLSESELQSAQVVLAAQDMIDRIQKMLEEVSEMQFKDLPALTDSIKNDMGIDQATQFQSASAAALTQLLQSLQQGKTQMEAAQGTLTGQAPVVPGQDPMAAPADPNMDPNMDAELDLNVDADIEPADDEEEPTPLGGAGLGRERR
jgi:Xaa-Pro aminopeptidase